MKEVKFIDPKSAFRLGVIFYTVVVGIIASLFFFYEIYSMAIGTMSFFEGVVGLVMLIIGSGLYVLFGSLSVYSSVWLYNKVAEKFGGVKVKI